MILLTIGRSWKTVKPWFTSKGTKKIILVEKGEIIFDNTKVTEVMNNYFVDITKELDISLPNINNTDKSDLIFIDPIDQIIYDYRKHPSILVINERIEHSTIFLFERVNASLIEHEIMELNSNKASGYDCTPPKSLKDSASIVKDPHTQLFNTSVKDNLFPSDLKYANVSPLFKKDDNTNKENYRPNSILPTISNIFESLMFHQITPYVSNILSPYLCGLREGYTTQHALPRLIDKINKGIDKKLKIGLFMTDLSKAFDCIPHELLIAKLHAYNFENQA